MGIHPSDADDGAPAACILSAYAASAMIRNSSGLKFGLPDE
jgi:hypothetical protein